MRRFLSSLFAVALALPLVGAAPVGFLPAPALVVYPMTVSAADMDKEAGSRLAVIIANSIANLGGVVVKPAPPGTVRKDYLETARGLGADYYIAGYLTPIGEDVSVVEQVVSAQSGIVVYSNTAQIRTYNDAAGQGELLRAAMLRHQNRNLGSFEPPPPPAAAPTPAASQSGEANIGKLFGRKRPQARAKPTPAPVPAAAVVAAAAPPRATPAPAAAPAAPAGSALALAAIAGAADADRRDYARDLVIASFARNGTRVATVGGEVANVPARAAEICASNKAGAIAAGNLATRPGDPQFGAQTIATFELTVYNCAGGVQYRKSFEREAGGDWRVAVERAVTSATGAYLHPPKRRR